MLGSAPPAQDPLSQLIAVISDPKAFEVRHQQLLQARINLDAETVKLQKLQAETQKKIDEHKKAELELQNHHAEVDRKLQELNEKQTAFDAYTLSKTNDLNDKIAAHEKTVLIHGTSAESINQQHSDKNTDLLTKERQLVNRDIILSQKENELEKRIAEIESIHASWIAEHETLTAQLKESRNTLTQVHQEHAVRVSRFESMVKSIQDLVNAESKGN